MPANTLNLYFTGATSKGNKQAISAFNLTFAGTNVSTRKESTLDFWGAGVVDITTKSEIRYQIL